MTTYSLPQIIVDLKLDEGTRLVVYDDATGEPIKPGSIVKGYPTIGTGRNLAADGITHTENDILLQNDIQFCANMLDSQIPWWRDLAENEQRVMLNLCFNMGWGTFSTFHLFLYAMSQVALNRSDRDAFLKSARNQLQASKWFAEVGERGPRMLQRLGGETAGRSRDFLH